MPPRPRPIEERFWEKVAITGPDECWLWQAGTNDNGYGRFRRMTGRAEYAHRMAYELATGRNPGDAVLLHSCDVRLCCNPRHLSEGTQVENLLDMHRKGRASAGRGERHGSGKLTEQQVLEILDSEESNTAMALRFGVKQHTISQIRTGKTWRHMKRAG